MNDPLPDYVDWRAFTHPDGPGQSFIRWLSFLTPPGAEVIPIAADAPNNTQDWPTDRYLTFGAPLILEAADPPYSRRRAERRPQVAERMPDAIYRNPGTHRPQSGRPMWTMKSAFFHDLYGYSTFDVAQMMDLKDESARGESDHGSRQGRRYVAAGRVALCKLGAWPWCLADMGRPSKNWYDQQRFAQGLATWHYQQSLNVLVAALAPVGWAATNRDRFGSVAIQDVARAAYRDAYGVVLEASERPR